MDLSALTVPVAQGEGFVRDPEEAADACEQVNDTVCFGWALDNADQFASPMLQHLLLVSVSVVAGFLLALALALISHRRRWLVPAFLGATGVIYTVPSIALFLLLLPITGRGTVTALIALTLYNLQVIYRNVVGGLANVPEASKDAGRGMGMSPRQLLWRVELPLALPEIIAGLRIASVSTVAIATLAIFAGAGGLGEPIYTDGINRDIFKTSIVVGSLLAVTMAVVFDFFWVGAQRVLAPWRRVRPL